MEALCDLYSKKMTGEKREKKETVQGYCMTEEKMRKKSLFKEKQSLMEKKK